MPIKERVNTDGTKEFVYTDEDRKRIESDDTKPTREFKEALRECRKKKGHRKYIAPRKYEEEPKKTKKSNEKKSYRIQLLILFIFMSIGTAYIYLEIQKEFNTETILKEILKIIPITEEKPIGISFTKYLNNISGYDKKDVTLTGFLNRELILLGTAGVYVESVRDNSGNKINLLRLKKEQINLFPRIGKTNELYNVTGQFKRKYKGLDLEVVDIVKS